MDRTGKRLIFIIVLVLVVFLGAVYAKKAMHSEYMSTYELPGRIGDWQGENLDTNLDFLRSELGAQSILFRTYVKQDTTITLYLAYYKDVDSANRVHSPTVCYPGQGWKVISDDVLGLNMNGRKVDINRLVIEKEKERELVYNWWQTGDAAFPRNSTNRFYQMYKSVSGDNPSTVWVRLSTSMNRSAHADESDIGRLTTEIIPLLHGYFTR